MPPYERRSDPDLSAAFAKDPAGEDFLEHLNRVLLPHAEDEYLDLPEDVPTLHIVGAPRSGTTLLYQLVASELRLGYVNNLIAAFWLAPAYGIRLARKLGLHELGETSFQSRFGRTKGAVEPHEFGYFWNHHLRYPDLAERPAEHESTIDWGHLRQVIINMAHAYERPMAFKPMLLTWHLSAMARHMSRSCFVWIRRRPRDTALSLLRMRRSLLGGYDEWASLRPAAVPEGEPPWRQVAAQVVLLEHAIETARASIGDDRFHVVDYGRLCAEPRVVVREVADLLGRHGLRPTVRETDLAPFTPSRNTEIESEFGDRVEAAIEHFAGAIPT